MHSPFTPSLHFIPGTFRSRQSAVLSPQSSIAQKRFCREWNWFCRGEIADLPWREWFCRGENCFAVTMMGHRKFAFQRIKFYFKESSLRFKESSLHFKESSLRFKESSFISKNQVCISKNQVYVSKNQVCVSKNQVYVSKNQVLF